MTTELPPEIACRDFASEPREDWSFESEFRPDVTFRGVAAAAASQKDIWRFAKWLFVAEGENVELGNAVPAEKHILNLVKLSKTECETGRKRLKSLRSTLTAQKKHGGSQDDDEFEQQLDVWSKEFNKVTVALTLKEIGTKLANRITSMHFHKKPPTSTLSWTFSQNLRDTHDRLYEEFFPSQVRERSWDGFRERQRRRNSRYRKLAGKVSPHAGGLDLETFFNSLKRDEGVSEEGSYKGHELQRGSGSTASQDTSQGCPLIGGSTASL